jgi:pimeloyl-ACP methyl ester carboxylesterase
VRPLALRTGRGLFAALDAMPATGVCERRPALLVPGFTGSKEDFLPILRQLAAAGRRAVAIDMRGQYETGGTDQADAYSLAELGADIGSIAATIAADPPTAGQAAGPGPAGVHLLGHSFGGLVARHAILAGQADACSLTLMSSGPGKLTGPWADILGAILDRLPPAGARALAAEFRRVWDAELAPQARAEGTPPHIMTFLERRMLDSSPDGLVAMGRQLLGCEDLTDDLAEAFDAPILVLYGEYDDKWQTPVQEEMAARLGAQRLCIPAATHSPAVEAPETTASALTAFWNAAEAVSPVSRVSR